VALCSDLAALANSRFDRCALLRCGIILYAINAPTLIWQKCHSDRMLMLHRCRKRKHECTNLVTVMLGEA